VPVLTTWIWDSGLVALGATMRMAIGIRAEVVLTCLEGSSLVEMVEVDSERSYKLEPTDLVAKTGKTAIIMNECKLCGK